MDPKLATLLEFLDADEEPRITEGLVEIAELLNQQSAAWRTGCDTALVDSDTRALVRSRLIDFIDRDRTRPLASTAIWVLGKLYDESLESYFAQLAHAFVDDDTLFQHLRQLVIALDNLEAIPALQESVDPDEIATMRRVIHDYLRVRGEVTLGL